MFITLITCFTQLIGCTKNTFMYIFRNLIYPTSWTLKFNFNFIGLLFLVLSLFMLQIFDKVIAKRSSAHWTSDSCFSRGFVLSPNFKTLQMEIIATFNSAITQVFIFTHWLLAYGTNWILVQFHPFCLSLRITIRSLFYFPSKQIWWQLWWKTIL